MIIDDDGWGYAIECMWGGFMRKTFGDIPNAPIEESVTISRCGLELAEEVLFRTRPPPPSSFAAEKEARLLIRLLLALDTKYLDESRSHAAAAGAIQHLLTRPNEQRRLATIYQRISSCRILTREVVLVSAALSSESCREATCYRCHLQRMC